MKDEQVQALKNEHRHLHFEPQEEIDGDVVALLVYGQMSSFGQTPAMKEIGDLTFRKELNGFRIVYAGTRKEDGLFLVVYQHYDKSGKVYAPNDFEMMLQDTGLLAPYEDLPKTGDAAQ